MMFIKRDYYLNKLIRAKHNGLIKIVTGIRRCGKSYLLDPIFKEELINSGIREDHIIKVDLEIEDNSELLIAKNLNEYVKSKIVDGDMHYVILDEIQKVENFEAVLNGFLKMRNLDIYVTGSNSKFLSSDIVTEFRGRGTEIKVYPLSFGEFMSVYEGNILDGWNEYYTYGGLPLILNLKTDEEKAEYLKEQKNNVYINDVVERNKIRNSVELETLVQIISSSIGSLTNPYKLENTFKSMANVELNHETIDNYLKYVEEAFLIEKASRYDVKGKKYINTPVKYYFTDMGIRNSFVNYRQIEESHLMENIIYIELKRRGYEVDIGVVEFREKNGTSLVQKQVEIDFIANKGNNKIYIQSALNMNDNEKMYQEKRPLLKANDNFKKIIITGEYIKSKRDEDGIITMSIYEFLTNMDSLESV